MSLPAKELEKLLYNFFVLFFKLKSIKMNVIKFLKNDASHSAYIKVN